MGSENEIPAWVEEQYQEVELTERERALRDVFVEEYLTDYNAYAAALRIGFIEAFAEEFARRFMQEGYVRRRIKQLESKITIGKSEENERWVLTTLKRLATYNGPGASHSARVSATKELAAIYGMYDKPEKKPDGVRGGVMLVPGLPDPDSWGQAALDSQLSLKSTVRD